MTLAVAAIVFWLGFDGGAYGLESRTTLAIAIWWVIIVAVALGLWPLVRCPRAALLAGAFFAAYAVVTAASMAWAPSAERAFTEFNRASLYLGVFLIAVLAGTRSNVGRWADGMALGITSVGLLALASRLFPDALPAGDVPAFLPSASVRLSYPLEYWNGLAILVALAFPFLLRSGTTAPGTAWRAGAVAALPALGATIYLTSSRGGVATALVGTIAFLALTERRWAAAGATALAAAGTLVAVAVLHARAELVNDPFESEAAASQGKSAAALIVLTCALTGLAYAVGLRFVSGRLHLPSFAGRAVAVAVILAALVGVAASDPIERFETFKQPPGGIAGAEKDFVRAHLLSGNGSGRWQFWVAAVDEFESSPVVGRGAGSYEAWWAQHGTIPNFVRDAHSLYLENLGELGLVGFALVASLFAVGAIVGVHRALRSEAKERVGISAFAAAFLAYTLAAGVDWMWELTVVSVIGIACLGFLTGPATEPNARGRPILRESRLQPSSRSRFLVRATALALGWLIVCAQAIPLLAEIKIRDSQASVGRGDAVAALSDAGAARNLQPWAASPYLQLALVEERTNHLASARKWIGEAIERDEENWRLWLVAARLETKAGAISEARKSLARAAGLNPRSPLFADRNS